MKIELSEVDYYNNQLHFVCPICKYKKRFTAFSIPYWLNKGMTLDDAKKQVTSIQSKISSKISNETRKMLGNKNSPYKISNWITKGFTEDEAIAKIRTYKKFYPEYWISRGYTEEEAKINSNKFQIDNLSKVDRNNIIYNTQLQYYLNKGFSEDEAASKLKDRQSTFTLKKCILKYGEEKGTVVFNERQMKWKNKVYNENRSISTGYSNMQKELAEILNETYPNLLFGRYEKFIWNKEISSPSKYDICNPDTKKIIEFNGDFWHCNPKEYRDENFIHPISKKTAKELWANDEYKIKLANSFGYEVLTIWESDYKNNKEEIIEICKNFLK